MLGVAELGVRYFVLPRSQSASTVLAARKRGASLVEAKFNVAVFGNSYTLCGVDSQALETEAESQGTDLAVHALNGSYVCEWYWLIEHGYLNSVTKPDLVVLNVGKTSLIDRGSINHRRLALSFGNDGLPAIPFADLEKQGKFCEFFVSRYSMLINRGRNVGEQLSMRVVPKFSAMNSKLQNRKKQQNSLVEKTKSDLEKPSPQVEVAKRIFDALQEHEIKCIVVLMPHKERYELDAPLTRLLAEYKNNVEVIDHRDCKVVSEVDFKDKVHLSGDGQSKYSPVYVSDVLNQIDNLKQ